MPPVAPSPAPILNLLQAFHASGVVNAGIQLGVFAALAKGPRAASQVAAAIRCPERAVGILCDALVTTGLLAKETRRYRLTPDSADFLVPGQPGYAGDAARILCDPVLWDAFGRFAQAVKHGGTVLPLHAETPGQKFWETFADSSRAIATPAAEYAGSLLQRFLDERTRPKVLDLGCGSGLYGLTIARKCPGAQVTLLDGAQVIPSARKRAKEMGLEKRVKFVTGDLFKTDLGGPYDVIVASHVLHHFSAATCTKILDRIGKATVPGGRLLVHEFVADEDRVGNPHAAMFAAVMLAWTREGQTYTFHEYTQFFNSGGFIPPVLHAPPQLTSQFLVAERKSTRTPRKK
ncbi:MAG: methyltransferase domain-containing protein [Planctomycetes bacterium]|nr:methyltransferase domain-containing protein [Planctomycetota bacterium]